MSDYILTIDSDTEDTFKTDAIEDVKLDPDFVFDPAGDPYSEIINKSFGIEDFVKTGSKPVCPSFVWLFSLKSNTKFQGSNICR